MIRFVLKLWSSNTELFAGAVRLKREGAIDGVELYDNVKEPLDWASLETMKEANVITIHNPHSHGWHDYWMTEEQKNHWNQTKELADFFGAKYIIVHPARTHTRESFSENFRLIADERILVENMAGLDIDRQPMQYGVRLDEIKEIFEQAPICFDLEKAVKGAAREGADYKNFITEAIGALRPTYFHISSGVASDAVDQHLNLWEENIDMRWVKERLAEYSEDKGIFLAFETPKADGLANDVKNMDFFRGL